MNTPALTQSAKTDLDRLNAWGVRLALAARGWHSDTRLMSDDPGSSGEKTYNFQVWFSRWDWHGRTSDKIVLHTGIKVSPRDEAGAVAGMSRAVHEAAALALQAWEEFPHSIPHMGVGRNPDGALRLVEDRTSTDYIFRKNGGKLANCYPTEALTDDPSTLCDLSSSRSGKPGFASVDPTLLSALRLADAVGWYQDDLTTFGRNENRARGDVKDRVWGFDYCVVPREWNGVAVSYDPLRFSVNVLAESMVTLSLDGTRQAMEKLTELYGPTGDLAGTTPNGLPPGMITLKEKQAAEEAVVIDRLNQMLGHLVRDVQTGRWDDIEAKCALEVWQYKWENSEAVRARYPRPTAEWLSRHVESLAGIGQDEDPEADLGQAADGPRF
jgi:hypothetical protein